MSVLLTHFRNPNFLRVAQFAWTFSPNVVSMTRMDEKLTGTSTVEIDGKHKTLNAPAEIPLFKLTARIYASFAALCVIVLTEALDATSISVVLPVSRTLSNYITLD